MKEKILALLKDSGGRALTTDEFIDKLKLNTKDDIKTFVEELNKLCEDGEVYYTKKNKYILFEDSHMLKGTIMITASGNGFVKVEGYDKDIFIDKRDLNGAIEKDLVALELNRSNPKEGKIIKLPIFKDPKTDRDTGSGFKKSNKGCCIVTKENDKFVCKDEFTYEDTCIEENLLKPIFIDGKMVKEESLSDIRNRLNNNQF